MVIAVSFRRLQDRRRRFRRGRRSGCQGRRRRREAGRGGTDLRSKLGGPRILDQPLRCPPHWAL